MTFFEMRLFKTLIWSFITLLVFSASISVAGLTIETNEWLFHKKSHSFVTVWSDPANNCQYLLFQKNPKTFTTVQQIETLVIHQRMDANGVQMGCIKQGNTK